MSGGAQDQRLKVGRTYADGCDDGRPRAHSGTHSHSAEGCPAYTHGSSWNSSTSSSRSAHPVMRKHACVHGASKASGWCICAFASTHTLRHGHASMCYMQWLESLAPACLESILGGGGGGPPPPRPPPPPRSLWCSNGTAAWHACTPVLDHQHCPSATAEAKHACLDRPPPNTPFPGSSSAAACALKPPANSWSALRPPQPSSASSGSRLVFLAGPSCVPRCACSAVAARGCTYTHKRAPRCLMPAMSSSCNVMYACTGLGVGAPLLQAADGLECTCMLHVFTYVCMHTYYPTHPCMYGYL